MLKTGSNNLTRYNKGSRTQPATHQGNHGGQAPPHVQLTPHAVHQHRKTCLQQEQEQDIMLVCCSTCIALYLRLQVTDTHTHTCAHMIASILTTGKDCRILIRHTHCNTSTGENNKHMVATIICQVLRSCQCNAGCDDTFNGGVIGQVEEQHGALKAAILLKVLHTT